MLYVLTGGMLIAEVRAAFPRPEDTRSSQAFHGYQLRFPIFFSLFFILVVLTVTPAPSDSTFQAITNGQLMCKM